METFSHEALLYGGLPGFLDGTVPFIREGVEAGEPVLVVVDAEKIALLRDKFGDAAETVQFADMAGVGRNPACIIPAWRGFLDKHAPDGRAVRGIGEPVWAGRRPAELIESIRHESLLNVAFAGSPFWRLLCPYDVTTLEPEVLGEAFRTHPTMIQNNRMSRSSAYVDGPPAFDDPLPEPPAYANSIVYNGEDLPMIRRFVDAQAQTFELSEERCRDLVLSVNELATNSLRYGGGCGMLTVWHEDDELVCEVRDEGRFVDPLVGRAHPAERPENGRGIWLVNHLCDLVEVRSYATGAVVRVRMAR